MQKICLLAFAGLIAATTTIFAQETPPKAITTPDALRTAIYAGEFDAVETALATAQDSVVAGDLDADALRNLMGVFAVTHPDTIAFARTWLRDKPDSAYAMMANAWILYRAGWIIRGGGRARDTNPEAMRRFYELHQEALGLALDAYAINPKLIPASDAIIMLANGVGDTDHAFHVFETTMRELPNWGSVTRAFGLAHPGWGGRFETGELICRDFAPLVDLGNMDAEKYCMVQFLVDQRTYQRWPAMALEVLNTMDDDPWLDWYRFLVRMNTFPMQRAEAEAVRDYVEANGLNSLRWADIYDNNIAMRWNFEYQAEKELVGAKERARAALEHDPYNPAHLDVLMRQSHHVTRTETVNGDSVSVKLRHTPIKGSPSPQDKLMYLQRKVVVAPYDAQNWEDLAGLLRTQSIQSQRDGADLIRWDGYYQNAVHYGMHDIRRLEAFAREKITQLARYETFPEHANGQNGWDDALQTIDRNADLVCPIVRLGILMTLVLEYTEAPARFDPKLQSVIDGLTADAQSDPDTCPGMLEADPHTLGFDAVPLDVLGQVSPYTEGPYLRQP